MAKYELLLPKMGESVAEATIIKWLKQPGDTINLDDTLIEIATDKVDSEVPSPVAGKLISQLYQENDVVQVGAVIALMETDNEEIQEGAAEDAVVQATAEFEPEGAPAADHAAEANPSAGLEDIPGTAQLFGKRHPEDATPGTETERFYSPLVKSIAIREGITPQQLDRITGTGAEGRLTKDDLLSYLHSSGRPGGSADRKDTPYPPQQEIGLAGTAPQHDSNARLDMGLSGGEEIIEMDRMGKLIAEHMVMSKQTSAHVTSFVEADVTNMVLWREKVKKNFEKREHEKITFTPIFIEAVAKAIKDFPMINVSVNGNSIIRKKDINIGMAAALPSGNLIVPVIRNADQFNLVGLTKAVNDLAFRSRSSKLKPDETQNGTFTITNVGSFGNITGTPIINQPQVAILAVGTIKKKPAVLETEFGDVIAIRHLMILSLSYDHRVVNGALGGTFVKRVADYLENWDINREI